MGKMIVSPRELSVIKEGLKILSAEMIDHGEKVMYYQKGNKRVAKIMLLCQKCSTDKNIQGCEDGIVICSKCNKQPFFKRLKDYFKLMLKRAK